MLICVRIFILFVALIFLFTVHASAQTRIIRKTVDRTVEPPIAPAIPPEIEGSEEAVEILMPPPPPTSEFKAFEKEPGIFRMNQNAEVTGAYVFENLLLGTLFVGGNLIVSDSNHLGEKIGLAEDALEYKIGLGLALGYDSGNNPIFSIPLQTGATLYFKEGSLYGYDPFAGIGFNLNLIGTDFHFGGIGYQLFGGILADLGWLGGKTGLAIGYNSFIVEGARQAKGVFFSLTQPIRL